MNNPTAGRFNRDSFFVNQKHLTLGKSKFKIFDEDGRELFFAERPVLRLFGKRANVTIYGDEQSKQPLLTLQQEENWELFNRNYTLVEGSDGSTIARLCRNNFRSLFRRSWQIYEPGGKLIGLARENSTALTIIRRVVDFIPYVNVLGLLIKTDFELFLVDRQGNESVVGRFDRRIAVGLGLLLDTAEAR
jgi:hypothetical protein